MRLSEKRCETRNRTQRRPALAAGWRRTAITGALAGLTAVLAAAPALLANSEQKNKKEPETTGIVSPVPPPDPQAVDMVVSQMLGSWQIGDVERMHQYYADDVTVVSAAWEAPLMGWENYARSYKLQYARTQGGRLDRRNTYAKVLGDNAWVTYQWMFNGQVDGTPTTALGHTTLMLEKRAGKWIIVLNHTSAVPAELQPGANAAGSPQKPTPSPSGPQK